MRFPKRSTTVLSALLAIGLITGCADRFHERRLIQPEGAGSQACLERCARLQGECEARQDHREKDCAERVSAANADQDTCRSGAAGPCVTGGSCLGADVSICKQQYEECFSACGGRVEQRLRLTPAKPHPG